MLTFKLSRRGKKKQPTYRLVVVDKKKDPWGMIKEDVGSYNPHTKKSQFKIERIKFWISKGAQPSPTVHNILVKEKILDAAKKRIKIKKKKGEEKPAAAPAAAAPKKEEPTAEKAPVKPETPVTEPIKPETPPTV
jgi:small subunit ribosomal protein S16